METKPIKSTSWDGGIRTLYPQTCKDCDKTYYAPKHRPGEFCNNKCRLNNQAKNKHMFHFTCAHCEQKFTRGWDSKSKSGLYFCSRKCKDTGQQIKSGLSAIQPSHYGTGVPEYRKLALSHYPAKCNRCSYDKYPSILRVHHIDRDHGNSRLDNLEVLCPNCHEEEHYLASDGVYSKHKKLVDPVGSAPTTFALQVRCSPK
jgi:5-methylcytosine-specific restriction endonuclease McrA